MKKALIIVMAIAVLIFMNGSICHAESEENVMAVFNEDIVQVELTGGTVNRTFMNHSIGSGDKLANRFGVRVFRNGQPENIGGTCAGYFIRADGETVVISNGAVSGNVAYVDLPEACYAVEGNFSLAIKCSGDGVTGTLRIVDGVVNRTTTETIVDPGNVVESVEDLIEDIEAAVATIPLDYSSLNNAVDGNIAADILRLDGEKVVMSSIGWEQGNFTSSNDDISSAKDIRTTSWFSGGVYIYNPSRLFQFSVMQNNGSGTKNYYDAFSSPVTGVDHYYDDKLVYIPKRKIGTYRIKVTKREGGTGSKQEFTPAQAQIYLYEAIDQQFPMMLGTVAAGGYSYDLTSIISDELQIGDHGGLRFKILNEDYRIAIYSTTNGTSFTMRNGVWTENGEVDVFNKTRRYVCRIGAKSGVTFDYEDAKNAVRIEYIDGNYAYTRHYTDITYMLNWEHKTITVENGIEDSTTRVMAELPIIGNVEVKMNSPEIKFQIFKISGNTVTMLQDWTNYFYRSTFDEDDTQYYVVVSGINDGTLSKFNKARRGIKVYTYEDEGVFVPLPSPFYGKSVAVMGDSIVQGRFRKNNGSGTNSVHSKPWPVLIAERSNTEPADYGIGGAPVYGDTWLSLYSNRNKISGYDVVLVCAGTNDYSANDTYTTEENFKTAYGAVLDALTANNTNVIAVTPPRRQQSINTTNEGGLKLLDYADFIIEVANEKNVPVIDLFRMTIANDEFVDSMVDGIHPNEAGQKIIADLILANVPE